MDSIIPEMKLDVLAAPSHAPITVTAAVLGIKYDEREEALANRFHFKHTCRKLVAHKMAEKEQKPSNIGLQQQERRMSARPCPRIQQGSWRLRGEA
jgi:hypothetical protein